MTWHRTLTSRMSSTRILPKSTCLRSSVACPKPVLDLSMACDTELFCNTFTAWALMLASLPVGHCDEHSASGVEASVGH
eukprot:UN4907